MRLQYKPSSSDQVGAGFGNVLRPAPLVSSKKSAALKGRWHRQKA